MLIASLCAPLSGCFPQRGPDRPYSSRTAVAYPSPHPVPEVVRQYAARLQELSANQDAAAAQDAPQPYVMPPAHVPLLPVDADTPTRSAAPGFPFRTGQPSRTVDMADAWMLLPPAPALDPPADVPAQPAAPAGPPPPPPPPTPPSVDDLITLFRAQLAENPDDLDLQLRLRMLYVIAGRDAQAVEPLRGLGARENESVASVIQAMIALRDGSGEAFDPDRADRMLQALQGLRQRLMAHADLRVPVLKLCRSVDGYGVYRAFDAPDGRYSFSAGRSQPVIVYSELRNHTAHRDEQGRYRTSLSMQLDLYDSRGQVVHSAQDADIQDVSANRREDFFLTRVLFLPPTLMAGEYTLRVTIEDTHASKVATATAPIRITPPGG